MRYLKICLLASIISCNSSDKTVLKMPGAYLMTSQTVTQGTNQTKNTDAKQLKIYTDKYVMYSQVVAKDSISSFGVGSYSADTSGVTENIIYTSRDSAFDDTARSYKLKITNTADGYNQVIPNIMINNTSSQLTEVYQRVGNKQTTTPLDGVWKQTTSYDIKGNDTMRYNRTEYKAFNNGYFMFGQTAKDSSGKINTGIGFGTFSMINDHQMKETDLNSTYSIIAGQSFMIDIQLNGNDAYRQIITHPDSSRTVEFYERLKL